MLHLSLLRAYQEQDNWTTTQIALLLQDVPILKYLLSSWPLTRNSKNITLTRQISDLLHLKLANRKVAAIPQFHQLIRQKPPKTNRKYTRRAERNFITCAHFSLNWYFYKGLTFILSRDSYDELTMTFHFEFGIEFSDIQLIRTTKMQSQ